MCRPGEVVILLREGRRPSYPYDGVVAEAEQSQVLAAAWPGPAEEVVCEKYVLQVVVEAGSQPAGVVGSRQENHSPERRVEFVPRKDWN